MFHTAPWTSAHSKSTPPLKAIKIWAHLTGVPLDLRHEEGLSLVAGLVGEPKETDDFTKNLVSLTLSHVKVEVDLTKPLPSVVEFEREDGDVVEVSVHYPWIPPTCSHCHELGHIVRNCLLYSPPPEDAETAKQKNLKHQDAVKQSKRYRPVSHPKEAVPSKSQTNTAVASTTQVHVGSETVTTSDSNPALPILPLPLLPSVSPPSACHSKTPLKFDPHKSLNLSNPPVQNQYQTPLHHPKPSLKRSRSSPTLSPPLSSNPNPFVPSLAITYPSPNPSLPPTTNDPSPTVQNVQTSLITFPPSNFSSSLQLSNSFVASGFSNLSENPSNLS